jgi:hypothetical protein
VIKVMAKKCRSAWKVTCSVGQPAASRQSAHSRDQVLSLIGFPCVVVNRSGTRRLTGSPEVTSTGDTLLFVLSLVVLLGGLIMRPPVQIKSWVLALFTPPLPLVLLQLGVPVNDSGRSCGSSTTSW